MDSTSSSSAEITSYAAIPMDDAATYTGPKLLRMCALVLQGSSVDGQLTFSVTISAAPTLVVQVKTADFTVDTTGGLVQADDITLFTGASAAGLVARTSGVEDLSSFLVCAQLEKHYPDLLDGAGTLTLTATYEPFEKTAVSPETAELAVSKTKTHWTQLMHLSSSITNPMMLTFFTGDCAVIPLLITRSSHTPQTLSTHLTI